MKAARPDLRIAWLVNTEWAPLLAGNPDVDEVVLFPRKTFRGLGGVVPSIRWLKSVIAPRRPDVSVDFQGLLRTGLMGWFSGARERFGLADAREGADWFYTKVVPLPAGVPHAVERYLTLAKVVVGSGKLLATKRIEFILPSGTPPVSGGQVVSGTYILVHPFSRGVGKSLTAQQVEQLCHLLTPLGQVILVGSADGQTKLQLPPGCSDYLNRTSLDELLWLVGHAGFVLSVDSGPMHLAAAMNRPLLSLHTWSDPRKVGPYRDDAWIWKSGRLFQFKDRHTVEPEVYERTPTNLQGTQLEHIARLVTQEYHQDS